MRIFSVSNCSNINKFAFSANSISAENRARISAKNDNSDTGKNGKLLPASIIGTAVAAAGIGLYIKFGKGNSLIARITGIFRPQNNSGKEIVRPKYLYHMTTLENFNSMIKDGKVKKSMYGDGVFLSNIEDLKNKYKSKAFEGMLDWYGGKCAGQGGPISKGTIVLLKLPLTPENEKMISWRRIRFAGDKAEKTDGIWNSFADFESENLKKIHNYPLEYLYGAEIPISNLQKAAEINTNELSAGNKVKDFWQKIGL